MKALWMIALAPLMMAQTHDILIHREGPGPAVQVVTGSATPVKGAPYSAEAVTETLQRLADGTRISHTQTTRLYRDGEGRTRTDVTVKPLGPWVTEGATARQMTTIHDPVSGENLTIDHTAKTVSRIALPPQGAGQRVLRRSAAPQGGVAVEVERGPGPRAIERVERRVIFRDRSEAPAGDVLMPAPGPIHFIQQELGPGPVVSHLTINDKEGASRKDLGKRTIEGVECEGVLVTRIVPEGAIGNDRPLEITTETWRSPELKMDLLRKHNDPRFGETHYRVVNLVRIEPARSLFEAPAGYEVKDAPTTFNFRVAPPKE